MKKALSVILALTMLLTMGSWLTAAAAEGTEKTHLVLWHAWATETDGNTIAFAKALASFAEDNPNIDLEVIGMSGTDYTTKLKVAFAANEGPDIFEIQGLGNMEPLVKAGKMLALDDQMAKNSTYDSLLPGSTNSFTFDGKVYGLPTITGLALLFCNTELFAKAGLEIPKTWDELLNCIKVFNENNITPFLYAGQDLWPVMFYNSVLDIRCAGSVECTNAISGKARFDSEPFLKAARMVQELTDAGAYNASDLSLSWDEGVQKFSQGGAAMLYNGTWVTGIVNDPNVPVYGKIEITSFPGIGGEYDTDNYGGAFECLCINSNVENTDAAYQAISYLGSHMSSESLVNGNGLPAWKYDDVDTTKLDVTVQKQLAVLDAGKNMCVWFDTALGNELGDIHKSLVLRLVTKEITPEEYCALMQSEVGDKITVK